MKACDGQEPGLIFTDRDQALQLAIESHLPPEKHLLCIWHLAKSLDKNLAGIMKKDFSHFKKQFWRIQQLHTKSEFDIKWTTLCNSLPPNAQTYLANHVTPFQDKWANYARIGRVTLGIQATSRVESFFSTIRSSKKTSVHDLAQELHLRMQQREAASDRTQLKPVKINDVKDQGFHGLLDELNNCSTRYIVQLAMENFNEGIQCYTINESDTSAPEETISPDFEQTESFQEEEDELDDSEICNRLEDRESSAPFSMNDTDSCLTFQVRRKQSNCSPHLVQFNNLNLQYRCTCGLLTQKCFPCKHIFAVWASNNKLLLGVSHWGMRWRNAELRNGKLSSTDNSQQHFWLSSSAFPRTILPKGGSFTSVQESSATYEEREELSTSMTKEEKFRLMGSLTRIAAAMLQGFTAKIDAIRALDQDSGIEYATGVIRELKNCQQNIDALSDEFSNISRGPHHRRFSTSSSARIIRGALNTANTSSTSTSRSRLASTSEDTAEQGQKLSSTRKKTKHPKILHIVDEPSK